MPKLEYFLYDGRYHTEPDRAIVFEVCNTIEEARKNKDDYGDDTVIVETEINKVKGMQVVGKQTVVQ